MDEQALQDAWEKEIEADESARGGRKAVMLRSLAEDTKKEDGDEDEDDDEPRMMTLEELRAIPKVFVSEEGMSFIEKVGKETDMVGRKNEDDFFRMTNTASSYEMFDIFERHLKKARGLAAKDDLPRAFEYALAIMVIFQDDDIWYTDTDDADTATRLVEGLFGLLRELLKETDEALKLDRDTRESVLKLGKHFRAGLRDSPAQIRVRALV